MSPDAIPIPNPNFGNFSSLSDPSALSDLEAPPKPLLNPKEGRFEFSKFATWTSEIPSAFIGSSIAKPSLLNSIPGAVRLVCTLRLLLTVPPLTPGPSGIKFSSPTLLLPTNSPSSSALGRVWLLSKFNFPSSPELRSRLRFPGDVLDPKNFWNFPGFFSTFDRSGEGTRGSFDLLPLKYFFKENFESFVASKSTSGTLVSLELLV